MDAIQQVFVGHTRRATGAIIVFVVLSLSLAGGALADKQVNSTDQAIAARDVLRATDLPPVAKWKKINDNSKSDNSSFSCAGFNPKSSDLVTTGEASTTFVTPGAIVSSDVSLLSTADMLKQDWKRTFVPALVPCLRSVFAKSVHNKLEIVSVQSLAFPKFAPYTKAYRFGYRISAAGKPVQGVFDMVALGGNRTEIGLFVFANLGSSGNQKAAAAAVTEVDEDLAQILVTRAFAPAAPIA